jgi:AmiR/NasT family two-component response regulator
MDEEIRAIDPCAVLIHADRYDDGEATQLIELRAMVGPRVPIVATVAVSTGEYVKAALEADVLGCLVRPLLGPELDEVLHRAIEWGESKAGSWGLIPAYAGHAREEFALAGVGSESFCTH